MLFHQRERQRQLETSEAEGQTFWARELSQEARYRLLYALQDLANVIEGLDSRPGFLEHVHKLVVGEVGLPSIANRHMPHDDIRDGMIASTVDIILSILEAAIVVSKAAQELCYAHEQQAVAKALASFEAKIARIFREHRISFDLINSRFVAFESLELHSEVVAPTLTLLAGIPSHHEVESAYRDALDEIGNSAPDDAITDAARALEKTLELSGCSGNTLGKKLTAARELGLLGDHDSQLREAILKIGSWIAADRASKGDTHPGGVATIDDAWLIVHVVGALILRLSRTPARGDGKTDRHHRH